MSTSGVVQAKIVADLTGYLDGGIWGKVESKKAGLIAQSGLCNLIPATTYAPTQLPVQYHRPGEA